MARKTNKYGFQFLVYVMITVLCWSMGMNVYAVGGEGDSMGANSSSVPEKSDGYNIPGGKIEVRAYIRDLEEVNKILLELGAVIEGEYQFSDYIYYPNIITKDCDFNKEFIRIRAYQKTNWDQKDIELVHKLKFLQGAGGVKKLKEQFDKLEEAQDFLLSYECSFAFSFERKGTEYSLQNSRIFVEKIEGLPLSIEIIAPSREILEDLLNQVNFTEVIVDSVPRLIELNRSAK